MQCFSQNMFYSMFFTCTHLKMRLPLQRYPENNLFTLKKTNTY